MADHDRNESRDREQAMVITGADRGYSGFDGDGKEEVNYQPRVLRAKVCVWCKTQERHKTIHAENRGRAVYSHPANLFKEGQRVMLGD